MSFKWNEKTTTDTPLMRFNNTERIWLCLLATFRPSVNTVNQPERGIIVALLAGSIQFMVIYHNRAERFDAIINNVNTYLKSYFHDLRQTIDGLQPLVDQPCENIDSGLPPTPRSAPTSALSCWSKRHRLLLIGYGSHEYALSQLIPAIDIGKPVAMAILPARR